MADEPPPGKKYTLNEEKMKAQFNQGQKARGLTEFEKEEQNKETTKLVHFSLHIAQPLYKLTAIFPLDLKPDELIIGLDKVSLIHRDLFGVRNIESIPSFDIQDAVYTSSALSAAIYIKSTTKELRIHHLPKKEADEAHKLLHGIVECNKAGIDLTKVHPANVKHLIYNLGKVNI